MSNANDKTILITGGAGFIGSHVVRLFVNKYPSYRILNFDKLTYAGNLENLKDVEGNDNYVFIQGDICDNHELIEIFNLYNIDAIIHLAAESHVDRSIIDPEQFALTNIIGTLNLLNQAKDKWDNSGDKLFYHISTDEVFGSLPPDKYFTESTPYDPKSPYSASKASADHFVRAYHNTYDLPILISNCSNNYGPFQFPEKLIPLMINNIINNKPLPVYGEGKNIRDWLYVEDHAEAIDLIFHQGEVGETYNIGGNYDIGNIKVVYKLCEILNKKLNRNTGDSEQLITFVADRQGHDLRYAIDSSKLGEDLGWKPETDFESGLEKTVNWYLENTAWLENVTSGEYQKYYKQNYLGDH